jgi:ankyrin repeat protein
MNNTFISNEKTQLRKCLKSYLTAKKYYDTDIDKSFEYFKQCKKILDDLKKNNIKNDNFDNIIDETETECNKYITLTIESTIEKPIIKTKCSENNELFEIIETGNIEKLKKYKYGEINFNIYNDKNYLLLHYAIIFGDTSFIKQSLILGARIDQTNKNGHTLFELACLEKDPNIISFLEFNGADMKKHLEFREDKKYFNNGNQLDILLIEKKILDIVEIKSKNYLDWIYSYIKKNTILDIAYMNKNEIKFEDLVKKIDIILDSLNSDARNTYISIIKEELDYNLSTKLGCPDSKLEIILYNLVPFIEYENLKLSWLLSLEVKYLILHIIKNNANMKTKELKKELIKHIYNSYIKTKIVNEGLIEIIVIQWLNKIKV